MQFYQPMGDKLDEHAISSQEKLDLHNSKNSFIIAQTISVNENFNEEDIQENRSDEYSYNELKQPVPIDTPLLEKLKEKYKTIDEDKKEGNNTEDNSFEFVTKTGVNNEQHLDKAKEFLEELKSQFMVDDSGEQEEFDTKAFIERTQEVIYKDSKETALPHQKPKGESPDLDIKSPSEDEDSDDIEKSKQQPKHKETPYEYQESSSERLLSDSETILNLDKTIKTLKEQIRLLLSEDKLEESKLESPKKGSGKNKGNKKLDKFIKNAETTSEGNHQRIHSKPPLNTGIKRQDNKTAHSFGSKNFNISSGNPNMKKSSKIFKRIERYRDSSESEIKEKQIEEPKNLEIFISSFQTYLTGQYDIIYKLDTLSNGIESSHKKYDSLIRVVYSPKLKNEEEKVPAKNTFGINKISGQSHFKKENDKVVSLIKSISEELSFIDFKNNYENPNDKEEDEDNIDVQKLLIEYQSNVNKLLKENQELIQENKDLLMKFKSGTQALNKLKEESETRTESPNLKNNFQITLLEQNLKIQRQNHSDLLNYLKEERGKRIKICEKFNKKQTFINDSIEKVKGIKKVFTVFDNYYFDWNQEYQDLLREYSDVCSDYQRKDEEYNEDLDKARNYVEQVKGLVFNLKDSHNSSFDQAFDMFRCLKLETENKIKYHNDLIRKQNHHNSDMWEVIKKKNLINAELINKIQEKWKSDRKDKKDTITKINDTVNSKIEIFESHIKIIDKTLNEGLEDTIKKHIKFKKDNKNQLKENQKNKAKLEKEIEKYNEVVLEYNKSLSEIDKEKFKKKIGAFKDTEIQYSYFSNLKIQAEETERTIKKEEEELDERKRRSKYCEKRNAFDYNG